MSDNNYGILGEAAKELAAKAFAGLKELGSDISTASKNAVHSAKADSRADATKKEINDAFMKLGELAYQNGGLTGEMQKVADKIRDLYSLLQDIEMARNDPDITVGSSPSHAQNTTTTK